MHYLTERNERRSRQSAIVMAILLHLGLVAAIYLATAQDPTPQKTPVPLQHLPSDPPKDGRTAAR